MLGHQFSKRALLLRDAAARVHDAQPVLLDDVVVLVEDLALEDAEAVHGVRAPAHVHARLVELQLHASREQAIQGHLDRDAEVHREVRPHREAVQLANLPIDAARRVARERRVGVAIGQHDHAGLERRNML